MNAVDFSCGEKVVFVSHRRCHDDAPDIDKGVSMFERAGRENERGIVESLVCLFYECCQDQGHFSSNKVDFEGS